MGKLVSDMTIQGSGKVIDKTNSLLSFVIEKGLAFLLIFTPMALSTIHIRSAAVMEVFVFLVFGSWLFKISIDETSKIHIPLPLLFFFSLIVLFILQLVPLPLGVLTFLSPESAHLHGSYSAASAGSYYPITIASTATVDELFKVLSYCLVFLVIVNYFKTKKQIIDLMYIIVFMGFVISLLAIFQKLNWNGSIFWFYPVEETLKSNMTYIWGPFVNHNHFAGYMELIIPLSISLLIYKLMGLKTSWRVPLRKRIVRLAESDSFTTILFLMAASTVMSLALFLTLSRGAIISFTIALLFFVLMARSRQTLRKKAGIVTAVILAVILILVISRWDRVENRFQEIAQEGKIMRPLVWKDSVVAASDFAVLGAGLGSFKHVYPLYQTGYGGVFFEHVENDYIEAAAEGGLLGFVLFISMIVSYFVIVFKRWRVRRNSFVLSLSLGGMTSVLSIAIHSWFDFNLHIPSNGLLLSVVAGLTYATLFNVREKMVRR